MSLYLLQGAVEEGLIYALVALGLFISYKILGIADMTTDGSFVLGSAVSSMLVISGHPVLALPVGFLAGMLAGLVTAILQTELEVPSILAGIISMTGLYTVNLLVQKGSPNLFYAQNKTIFTMAKAVFSNEFGVVIAMIIIVALIGLFIAYFLSTQLGLSIRATGDNINMIQASSINPTFTITVGLMLSNGLIALAGALMSSKNTQGDINIGTGVVVIGLASLVLGGVVFRGSSVFQGVLAAIFGAVVYRIIFTIALRYTPDPGYLKIVSAGIVAVVIAYPKIKKILIQSFKRRENANARVK